MLKEIERPHAKLVKFLLIYVFNSSYSLCLITNDIYVIENRLFPSSPSLPIIYFLSECITSQLVRQKLVTVEMIIMSLKIVALEGK